MLPRPPSRIGPFAVVRALGRGGMGVVYEVEDPLARRRLALKLVSESAASAQASERFWREAELLARVRHPGVVTIHKLGRAAEGPYLVQELVEGAPLSALCEDGPLAPARAAELVRDLARAVEAVHAQGILHRDLKPQNVIVRARDGRPVLLDFGLAREVDSETLTKTGVPLGTPAFMSPEQARGQRDLDARTDVYGLGAVLYALLAGRPPFEGESFVTLLARVLREPPPPLPEQVPPDLAELCRATLAKAPADRPPTAAALALDLDRFLAGEGTRHRAPPPRARSARIVVAGLAGLAALGGGLLALDRGPGPDPARSPTEQAPVASEVPPAPPPLWRLAPGDRLALASHVEETGAEQGFTFDVELEAVIVEAAADGRLRAEGRCTAVKVSFGAAGVGGMSFDAADADPDHPLAGIAEGLGRPFTFEVDPATGAIDRLSGVDPIGQRIASNAPDNPLFAPALYRRFCRTLFSDGYVEAVLRSLSCVRPDPDRPLPWTAGPAPGEFLLPEAAPAPPVVPPIGLDWRPHADDRYLLRGRSRFVEGRLLEAEVEQELVGSSDRRCAQRWTASARLLGR